MVRSFVSLYISIHPLSLPLSLPLLLSPSIPPGGRAVGRVWTISVDGEKLDFMDFKFAKHLHDIVCIEVADYDCLTNQMAFCGTSRYISVIDFLVHKHTL